MVTQHNKIYKYCKNVMLYEKVQKTIKENSLIKDAKVVIAAVSGGADSVCLLDVLDKLSGVFGFSLECAHLNHNLRGEESDGDERYVRKLCAQRNIPLHVKSVDVMALAKNKSIEDAARNARYDFFDELTCERKALVATAHTVNDNTETFFINLVRGSGTRGLCGIPMVRGNIIRPLLDVTRAEIIEHLKEHGLEYRTDSTNSDTEYLRNFIRHEVVGKFAMREDIDVYKTVSRAIANLQKDNKALEELAKKQDTDDCNELKELSDAVLYRVLTAKAEKEFSLILDSKHFELIKQLLCKNNSRVQIKGDIYAKNEYGKFSFYREYEKESEVIGPLLDKTKVFGKTVLIKKDKEIYKALTNKDLDCDKIGDSLYARTRRDGDIVHCTYRQSTTKLKKLFIGDKLTKADRDRRIIVCNKNGEIVFVEGYGADKRFLADSNSKNIIRIEII